MFLHGTRSGLCILAPFALLLVGLLVPAVGGEPAEAPPPAAEQSESGGKEPAAEPVILSKSLILGILVIFSGISLALAGGKGPEEREPVTFKPF